ncbi:phosphotransferase [Halobaculum sp. WSA2]|uniref:Phosphotransferase n=1 Tax=Halobaculum saliterrae TaxID=2073113 RepID=A0A6B0SXG7_9EURY|nr:phosphotransferase [Halobaculum saliterrae]MXR41321.1 phosphotransferase [Halobaculum saliterrae]
MDHAIRRGFAAAFPGRPVAGVRSTGPSWNDDNETVRVAFADDRRPAAAFLKVALDGDGSRIRRESACIGTVDAADIALRVPDVLAADPDADPPVLATAPMAGDSVLSAWSDAGRDGTETLTRAMGAALASVHTVRFDAHGEIRGEARDQPTAGGAKGLSVDEQPWTEVLVGRIERMRAIASSDRLDDHFDRVADAVRETTVGLDDAPATLVHGDPAKPNAVVAEHPGDAVSPRERRVGLLDWELSHVGDPAREVVRAERQLLGGPRTETAPRLRAALHEGYRGRAGALPTGLAERRPVYEAVGFLGFSGFVDKQSTLLDENEDELVAWAEDELDRRLVRVPR